MALLPAVREIVHSVDSDQPISDVMTLSELLSRQTADRRAQVRVLGALAAVALLLAGLGIYGLLAYTVVEQRHEIAVRLAMGEEPRRLARTIVRNGVAIALFGAVPGILVALVAARSLRALLFGVPTVDPATLAITLAVCFGMSVLGALLPAIRAVRISPMSVMRSE
jgi:ABC-type antimicrobial peptide transport system permease subunit